MRPSVIIALLILWSLLVLIAPSSVFWRDSGEFILQAFTLDIAHPAGFPSYAQIANLFALIPVGPIAWRATISSSFCLVLVVVISGLIRRQLMPPASHAKQQQTLLFDLLFFLLLITFLPLTIKQAQSAEVYLLNSAFILGICWLLIAGIKQEDPRYFLSAAFLGGLSIGNHISSALSGIIIAIALCIGSPLFRRQIIRLIIFFSFGLAVYLYLPLRASTDIALNSGQPSSLSRFIQVVTDARDRQLRPSNAEEPSTIELAGFEKLIANPLTNLRSDIKKLRLLNNPLLLILVALSTLYCFRRAPLYTTILAAAGFGNYLFFAGWDGDPWVVAIAVIALFMVSSVEALLKIAPRTIQAREWLIATFLMVLVCAAGSTNTIIPAALELRDYRTPARFARDSLRSSDAPIMISENSWFLFRYLADIEGVADTKMILYQPSILFPRYFKPIRLQQHDGTIIDLSDENLGTSALGILIEKLARDTALVVEPSQTINEAIKSIAFLTPKGASEILRGTYSESSSDLLANPLREQFATLLYEPSLEFSFVKSDANNFLDNIMTSHINLWEQQGRGREVIGFIDSLCQSAEKTLCSLAILNNRGLLLLRLKDYSSAADYYKRLIILFPEAHQMLSKNLSLASNNINDKLTPQIETEASSTL